MAAAKKEKEKANALEDVALVMGTQQNLSNLYSLDIYGMERRVVEMPRVSEFDLPSSSLSCHDH
jgi:hypothetical protein